MEHIKIFTDGSSRGNPGPGGFGAIIVNRESYNVERQIVELGGRDNHTTNNRMELMAAIKALEFCQALHVSSFTLHIHSDSKYVIKGITEWVYGWQKNGWKTANKKPVENQDLWEKLFEVSRGLNIEWKYVEGHAGHGGNERCDEIATSFADGEPTKLYTGPAEKYPVNLSAPPTSSLTNAPRSKLHASRAKSYSYLSMVDGKIDICKTWAECEKRVKGVSGAKWKKAISKEDEENILREWGANL